MAGNHTNAYASAEPNRFSLADTIAQQDQLNFQREEQRRRNEQFEYQKKKELKEERRKNAKEFWDNAKQVELTGVTPIDQLLFGIVDQAMNKHLELYNAVESGKMSSYEAKPSQERLNMIPKRLKMSYQNLMSEVKSTTDAISKGEIVLTPEIEKSLKSISGGKGTIRLNDDGSFDFIVDVDGDGNLDVISEQEFMNKSWMPDKIKRIDLNQMSNEIAKEVAIVEEEWSKGNTDYHTKFPKEGSIKELIAGRLSNNDILKGALYAGGIEEFNFPTSESIDALNDYLFNQVSNRVDTFNKSKVDRNHQLAVDKFKYEQGRDAKADAEKAAAAAAKKAEGTKNNLSEPTTPTEQGWGKNDFKRIQEGAKSVSISGGVKIPSFNAKTSSTGKDKTIKDENIKDPIVHKYTYSNDGRILMDVEFESSNIVKKKEVKTKERKVVLGSKETEAYIAKNQNITVQELRERGGYAEQNMNKESSNDFDWSSY
ncbi:MAG: hypothetical protein LBE34_12695 [Flavobacteriaceae bacterium]|jgi:hypothetical protein|nr:hypothetical protein [Flavobacteriaceae bacterium]